MNIRPIIVSIFMLLALGSTSCSKDTPAKPEKTPATEQAPKGGHAPADVKPGSHEDWCEEHQVPESQCTRCDKNLIPAFKATGDWCAEHNLPESQCLKCNPDLKITRPPAGG